MPKTAERRKPLLNNKRLLLVDDEPDILAVLEEEIAAAAPTCKIDTATSYEEAAGLLTSWSYDLAVLDIMGVRGLDLLEMATHRENPIPVVMLTARALSPGTLRESIENGARAFLPKEHLNNIVSFLDDVLTHEYGPVWRRIVKQLEDLLNQGWGPYWRWPDTEFWKEFERRINRDRS